jgi:calcineurin-like phosphoesterase family protein
VVELEDEVWHLGNVARRAANLDMLLKGLNGTKHLVRGNNDPDATCAANGWSSVHDYVELEVDQHRWSSATTCSARRTRSRGAINLHGHSHGRLKPIPRQFDAGADVHDYTPVTLAQLLR